MGELIVIITAIYVMFSGMVVFLTPIFIVLGICYLSMMNKNIKEIKFKLYGIEKPLSIWKDFYISKDKQTTLTQKKSGVDEEEGLNY